MKKFDDKIYLKDTNWGRSKGGLSTYQMHPEIFEKGRKIAAASLKREPLQFHNMLSLRTGELLGAFIGDGFTNRYGTTYVTQFTGDVRNDYQYFLKLSSFVKELNPILRPILSSKDNTLRLTINSKDLHYLLTGYYGFTAGKKVYTVTIPPSILNPKNQDLINRCVRGIFDTDGGIYFDKRESYKQAYVRIGLKMESPNLIKQIFDILSRQGIQCSITADCKKLQINGMKNCLDFVEKIGFTNERHLKKLRFLVA